MLDEDLLPPHLVLPALGAVPPAGVAVPPHAAAAGTVRVKRTVDWGAKDDDTVSYHRLFPLLRLILVLVPQLLFLGSGGTVVALDVDGDGDEDEGDGYLPTWRWRWRTME